MNECIVAQFFWPTVVFFSQLYTTELWTPQEMKQFKNVLDAKVKVKVNVDL